MGRLERDFNPRSPNGLRLWRWQIKLIVFAISIHAARMGCDYGRYANMPTGGEFQSTQPEWAATDDEDTPTIDTAAISIHAARMGCDNITTIKATRGSNFNPRSPNGLRRTMEIEKLDELPFQSTQPEWAATVSRNGNIIKVFISIHAARMGCDHYFHLSF